MIDKQIEKTDLLIQKMAFLEELHENIIMQERAIEGKNTKKLVNLLDESRKIIDIIHGINTKIDNVDMKNFHDEGSLKVSKVIKSKIEELYKSYYRNYTSARKLTEELRFSIKRINLGKKAIIGGYLKKQQQVYGYFVDKKVGKGSRY